MPAADRTHYQISPHLTCIEKTDLTVTLCHFGNVSLHNSFNSDLTLAILRTLKTPMTLNRLVSALKSYEKTDVQNEFQRLVESFYVHAFQPVKSKKAAVSQTVFPYLAKNNEALGYLNHLVSQARIGIVDLCGVTTEFKESLRSVGFSKISAYKPDDKKIIGSDLCIVLGTTVHKLIFSKLNQLFHENNKLWILVTLDLFGGVVGPTFGVPGGPCYDCLIDQTKRHFDRQFQGSEYVDYIEPEYSPAGLNRGPMVHATFPFVALEAIRVLSRVARPMTYDGYYTFDMFNFRMNYNVVQISPTCPICSEV